MNDLERFHACMDYQPVDRAPFRVFGEWPETIQRWKQEGYDPQRFDPAAAADRSNCFWKWFFPDPPFERKVIHEDAEHITYINEEGIMMKEMAENPYSSMPQFLKFPVETRAEFRRFWGERMQPDLSTRIAPDWREKLKAWRAQPVPLMIDSDRWGGFFGPLRNLVGVEKLCTLYYDDPAFVQEMIEADADFIIAMMGQILDVVNVDAFWMFEDMAYNHAPLISPALVRQYMLPQYRRVTDFLHSHGVKYVGLDSDGQIDPLIPVWLDAGLDFLCPFEVQAGMDVLAVRRKYGRQLRIWGGIDKRALVGGPQTIDAELQRVKPLIDQGGYLPMTDHTVPPDVSYANYCYYLKKLEDVCRQQ